MLHNKRKTETEYVKKKMIKKKKMQTGSRLNKETETQVDIHR